MQSKRQTEYFPCTCSLTKYPQQPGLSQTKARSIEHHPHLSRGWQGTKQVSHQLPPSRTHKQKDGSKAEQLGLKPAVQYKIQASQAAPYFHCATMSVPSSFLLFQFLHSPVIYLDIHCFFLLLNKFSEFLISGLIFYNYIIFTWLSRFNFSDKIAYH